MTGPRSLVVVVRSDLRDAANSLVAGRNGGDAFTTPLTDNGTTPTHYLASWWADARYDPPWGDENGRFDLRDVLEDHPALAGKLRDNLTADGDGRFHSVDDARPPKWAVFVGWDQADVLDRLGATRLDTGDEL